MVTDYLSSPTIHTTKTHTPKGILPRHQILRQLAPTAATNTQLPNFLKSRQIIPARRTHYARSPDVPTSSPPQPHPQLHLLHLNLLQLEHPSNSVQVQNSRCMILVNCSLSFSWCTAHREVLLCVCEPRCAARGWRVR
ncbi:hypothetical protein KC19_1G281500 [Ceratodon purpureus]|uniref:Uncharacterized protein n=1 Tax=Ceratodon purpureus TaxID=3225 RepID=A0A8T0JBD7_CERPU|nr:hypothetical protein KC19_1G281500 [Ceratodon purpureus]